jgi:hypothetical protein
LIAGRHAVQLFHGPAPVAQDASELGPCVGVVRQVNFQNEFHSYPQMVSNREPRLRRMTILREWRGELRRELADEYVAYIRDTGLAEYRATPGNLGALIAVRGLDDERSEVITLSWWPSMDAIRGFAGDDVERAVYYPEDDRYLLTKPERVQHYESHGAFDPPAE